MTAAAPTTPKHSDLDAMILALHAALKVRKPKDLTDAQYEVLCVLDNEFSDAE